MIEQPRLDVAAVAPEAYRHLVEIEKAVASQLDVKLLHLINLRASQLNVCAFCLAMHTEEALHDGESPARLTALDAWEESPLFNERERAALGWVDAVTLIAERRAPRETFDALTGHFSREEIGWLTVASALINAWNRIAIASRSVYAPGFAAKVREAMAEPA
jgi:AhpD family alkylhydroperoxidase